MLNLQPALCGKMRKLYLIRHGEPDFPNGERVCLGHLDLPLSTLGKLQAFLTGWELRDKGITQVFSSRLSRARETAAFIASDYSILAGAEEISTGCWDGLLFSEIKRLWPDAYARRGADPMLSMPGGEDLLSARRRFTEAVDKALCSSEGDIAIVSHAQVIDLFLAFAKGISFKEQLISRLGYGSYICLQWFGEDVYLEDSRVTPHPALSRKLCLALLDAASVPAQVKAHCQAVAVEALKISEILPLQLDRQLIECAALLHDIARTHPKHPQAGAIWLRDLGYEEVADIVELHHDHDGEQLDEAAVLFIADKRVKGTSLVSLEERFAANATRYADEPAISAHQRRYAAAIAIKEKINGLCGQEVIK